MRTIYKISLIIVLGIILSLAACDPIYTGKTFVRNESSYILELQYEPYLEDSSIIILPYSYIEIFHFDGLGKGKDYDCCSCEFVKILLNPADTSKELTKNIENQSNWIKTNSNAKKFSGEEINCEFRITQEDIQ